jgi:putative peptidoglycan lipid II flippase
MKRNRVTISTSIHSDGESKTLGGLEESTLHITGLAVPTLARSTSIVAAAFVASRLLGLAREAILAPKFGTSGEYAAYVSAFRIPDLLFLVIMAGAFGSAFIPVFSGFLSRPDPAGAWRLASAVITLTAITVMLTAGVVFLFAGPIIRYLVAPGLSPENQSLAVELMRVLLVSPLLLGMGIAAKGILESHHQFTLPALAPVVYNISIMGGALLLTPSMGIHGVAIGVAVGALGHVLIQVPGLYRLGMRYRPIIDFRVDGLREVGRLLVPRLIGQAAFQVNFIAVNYFASNAGEEGVSALNYAWQLLMLPHGVIALSISTVIFPTMAQQYEQGRLADLQETLVGALRPLLFITLPVSIGLFAFRESIIQLALQRGEFNQASTERVAALLAWLALGLVGYAFVEVLTRAFYAMHDTRTPVATGLLIILGNVLLSAILVKDYGHEALAWSLSATTAAEALIMLLVLRNRFGGFGADLGGWLIRILIASFVTGLVSLFFSGHLAAVTRPGEAPFLQQIVLFGLGGSLVAVTYTLASYALRVPELMAVVKRISTLIRNR